MAWIAILLALALKPPVHQSSCQHEHCCVLIGGGGGVGGDYSDSGQASHGTTSSSCDTVNQQ